MRIAILGAGAMGCVFGGHLALAGHEVTLVDIRREHIDAVRERGLEMRTPDGEGIRVQVAAVADASELHPVELVIVLCKSYSTSEAARSIAHAVGADTWVATVQNGLGNDRRLAEVFGPERVIPGSTTVGAEQHEPGVTIMSPATAGRRSVTHLGPPRTAAGIPGGVSEIAAVLTEAGLPAEALESADVVIWTKLALAGSMAPLTALTRTTVHEIVRSQSAMAALRDMFEEIVALAHAEGVPLEGEKTWAHGIETFRRVGAHVSSMAADVLAQRKTEIDSFCGEVARRGERLGVPTPVNRTVWRVLEAIEASYGRAL